MSRSDERGDQVKVLIAYDGSESADTAIDGLRRAGLPSEADALVACQFREGLDPFRRKLPAMESA